MMYDIRNLSLFNLQNIKVLKIVILENELRIGHMF